MSLTQQESIPDWLLHHKKPQAHYGHPIKDQADENKEVYKILIASFFKTNLGDMDCRPHWIIS